MEIENKAGFNAALSNWMKNGGYISTQEWNNAMSAINAKISVSTNQSTPSKNINLTTTNVTTAIGKADIDVTIKYAKSTTNVAVSSVGLTTSIKLHYNVYSIYSGDASFNIAAMEDRTKLYEKEFGKGNVKAIAVDSLERFIEVWDAMAPERGKNSIENVTLCFHGSPESMAISDTGYLYNSFSNPKKISRDISIDQLSQKNIDFLYLASCNTGHLSKDDNMALSFLRNQPGIQEVRAWDGPAVYNGPAPGSKRTESVVTTEYNIKGNDWYDKLNTNEKDVDGNPLRKPAGPVHYTRDPNGGYKAVYQPRNNSKKNYETYPVVFRKGSFKNGFFNSHRETKYFK